MISAPGFCSNATLTMKAGSTDSTDSFSVTSTTINYSDSLPPPRSKPRVPDDELKAVLRNQSRELTLIAQAELAELHDQEQLLEGHQLRRHQRRPTRRRTCTAVQNFRGRP